MRVMRLIGSRAWCKPVNSTLGALVSSHLPRHIALIVLSDLDLPIDKGRKDASGKYNEFTVLKYSFVWSKVRYPSTSPVGKTGLLPTLVRFHLQKHNNQQWYAIHLCQMLLWVCYSSVNGAICIWKSGGISMSSATIWICTTITMDSWHWHGTGKWEKWMVAVIDGDE